MPLIVGFPLERIRFVASIGCAEIVRYDCELTNSSATSVNEMLLEVAHHYLRPEENDERLKFTRLRVVVKHK